MAGYPKGRIKGSPDPTATTVADGMIDMNNIRKNAAVTKHTGGWRYSRDDEVVHGSIHGVSLGHLQINVHGQDIKFMLGSFDNSGTETNHAIALNNKILGATRELVADGTRVPGYIKGASAAAGTAGDPSNVELARILNARGLVTAVGTAPTVNAEAAANIEVAMSYGLIVD